MMVEQFGFAIIPWWCAQASGLISGITSGTAGSMRNAEELSTTTAPACAARGPYVFEIPPPALKNAISISAKLSSVSSFTSTSRPANGIFLPSERADASRCNSEIGNCRSPKQRRNSTPTAPVAPTIATLYVWFIALTVASLFFDTLRSRPSARSSKCAPGRCAPHGCCPARTGTACPTIR